MKDAPMNKTSEQPVVTEGVGETWHERFMRVTKGGNYAEGLEMLRAKVGSIYLDAQAERAAVLALGADIGFGRIIQLAHECWDEMLEAKHGIKGHSESYQLAAADIIRERRSALSKATAQPKGQADG